MKDLIKKLNSIDIKDLKKFNLKSIDFYAIKEKVTSKPDVIISVVLIVVSVFAIIIMWGGHKKKLYDITFDLTELEEKAEAFEGKKNIEGKYSTFMESFPASISKKEFDKKITEMAIKHSINIETASEPDYKATEHASLSLYSMDVTTDDYNNLIGFVKDIEDSPYSLYVKQLVGSMTSGGRTTRRRRRSTIVVEQEEEVPKIFVKLQIGSVKLTEEK